MKHKRAISFQLLIVILLVFCAVMATAIILIRHFYMNDPTSSESAESLTQNVPGAPQFSFDKSSAPGWYQGPTDKVSMALFSDDKTAGCWTSIIYKDGKINAATELQKTQTALNDGGYTVTPGVVTKATLKTASKPISYELSTYQVTGGGEANKTYGGQEYAYFNLGNGYAKVQGYCNDVSKLPTITPALQALKFDPAN